MYMQEKFNAKFLLPSLPDWQLLAFLNHDIVYNYSSALVSSSSCGRERLLSTSRKVKNALLMCLLSPPTV